MHHLKLVGEIEAEFGFLATLAFVLVQLLACIEGNMPESLK